MKTGTRFDKSVLLSRRSALVMVLLLLLLQWPCASTVYALEHPEEGGSVANRIAQNETIEELQRRRIKQKQDAEEKTRRVDRLEARIWAEFADFGVGLMESYVSKGLKLRPIPNWEQAGFAVSNMMGLWPPGALVRSTSSQQIMVIALHFAMGGIPLEGGRAVVIEPEGVTDKLGNSITVSLTVFQKGMSIVGNDGSCEVSVAGYPYYRISMLSYKFGCDTNIFAAKKAEISAAFDRSLRAALAGPGAADKHPQTTATIPPSGSGQNKTSSLRDVLRQISREDQARIARYPANTQGIITQKSVAGNRAMQAGNWAGARDEYSEVVRYDPENLQANVDLSGAYAMLRDSANAKKYFDIVARRVPQYPVPYVNMVYAYARTGNYDEAVRYLEKVVELRYAKLADLRKDSDLPKDFREDKRVQELLAEAR